MEKRDFLKQIKEYMSVYHMIDEGDGILVAISGGADSVCLLLVLSELTKELGIHLAAFHLNHGLRGDEADRDETYVREICKTLEIPLDVVREDVRQYAAEQKMTEEEAGRVLRYRHLDRAAEMFGCSRIATAHHRDDQAETVLMNLFRGSGLKGLGGIRPVRDRIIRPLLAVSRQEIENYLYKKKAVWCEDSTNQELNYERNKVRNVLIPWIQCEVNVQAPAHIVKTAEFAQQADAYFTEQAEILLNASSTQETLACVSIPTKMFDAQPQIMKQYLVKAMIKRAAGSEKDLSSRHLEAVCALKGPGGGSEISLPYGLQAVRGYERLEIQKMEPDTDRLASDNRKLSMKDVRISQAVALNGCTKPEKTEFFIETRIFLWKQGLEIPKNQYTKWFDYDKIKDMLFIRTRETGDYFIIGGGKTKTLKRFFIDEKIPEAERDRILLLADGNHILWSVGYRISEEYKVTELTRTVLEVRIHKGEEHG